MRTIKRRRREKKTDYKARFRFLKSRLPRIVIRKSNRYIIVQLVSHEESQDFVKVGVSSRNLLKYDWPKEGAGSLKSIPACYLTGFLLGKRILSKDLDKDVIIDIGLVKSIRGSRVYTVVAGLKAAGINVKCEEEMFPKEDRLKGKDIKKEIQNILNKVKEKIEHE